MAAERTDLDSPWKDILRAYFPQALSFFFPSTAALIDWQYPHEFLDKEFQQIARDAELGRRYADQLVKVRMKNGSQIWLFIHVEVQSQSEVDFAERMYTYNLRIFDQFRQVPISLAILCDERHNWRPNFFRAEYPDTVLNFEFGIAKLLDFRARWAELESSQNPFATVTMAHLKTMETRPDAGLRKVWKLSLIRALYEKGYQRQEILDLYRFIDWVMILPEALERDCWTELKAFEEARKVTYVTTGERIGYERGMTTGERIGYERGMTTGERIGYEQGMTTGEQMGYERGERSLILRQLLRRVGELPQELQVQVESLTVEQLEVLGDALLDFSSLSDLQTWLRSQ
ncbi:MAG: DUF4351 domain-containing protein [Thermosynechococcaceae cyanobacterium]